MSEIEDFATQLRAATATLHGLAFTIYKLRFATLDLELAATSAEDWPARSWEVEREHFVRRTSGER